jgi:hypothetical protein
MEVDLVEGAVEHCCIQAGTKNFFLKLVLIFSTCNILYIWFFSHVNPLQDHIPEVRDIIWLL